MENLFQEKYKKNWIKFFEEDRVMMAQALALCETGVVKPKGMPPADYTNHSLWKKITEEQSRK